MMRLACEIDSRSIYRGHEKAIKLRTMRERLARACEPVEIKNTGEEYGIVVIIRFRKGRRGVY